MRPRCCGRSGTHSISTKATRSPSGAIRGSSGVRRAKMASIEMGLRAAAGAAPGLDASWAAGASSGCADVWLTVSSFLPLTHLVVNQAQAAQDQVGVDGLDAGRDARHQLGQATVGDDLRPFTARDLAA